MIIGALSEAPPKVRDRLCGESFFDLSSESRFIHRATELKETKMDGVFYSLQEFMPHSKNITYIVMGIVLIALPLFWRFSSGRDEKKRTY
jgi:hypothetical protein